MQFGGKALAPADEDNEDDEGDEDRESVEANAMDTRECCFSDMVADTDGLLAPKKTSRRKEAQWEASVVFTLILLLVGNTVATFAFVEIANETKLKNDALKKIEHVSAYCSHSFAYHVCGDIRVFAFDQLFCQQDTNYMFIP